MTFFFFPCISKLVTSSSTTKNNAQDELIKEDIKTDENEEGMEEWEIELRRAAKGL